MVTVRCTRKLLTHLKMTPAPEPPTSTTMLGDWFGNLLYLGRKELVLMVSARTLLPVLVEAAPSHTLLQRFPVAVAEVMRGLGVQGSIIAKEIEAMSEVVIARTNSRQVLGTMNDFAWMAEVGTGPRRTLLELSLDLAEAPCSPIGMRSPDDLTRELLRS